METILFLIAGAAIGIFIGWLLGKSSGRADWESKNTLARQQYVDLEKELVSYRASQTTLQNNMQQMLEQKSSDLKDLQHVIEIAQRQLVDSGALLAGVKADLGAANRVILDKQAAEENLKKELEFQKREIKDISLELATQLANNQALQEKLVTQKEEIMALNKKFNMEFENIANRILETKTEKFTELNKTNLNLILEPLGKNLAEFKATVEVVYQKESEQRFSLGERVKE
ncbi:hypothetical protein, partial [Flavihumibacter sp. CACIAM 22H1]|uniref:hypothetical protein n=1 Tax=Flavihumibacter sp. CACIAM 22H1 TaxID=1812911 RepID=UPI000A83BAC0